jgi:hypothetical protein
MAAHPLYRLMRRLTLCIVLAVAAPLALGAQWRGAKSVRPTSCSLADSLIGPIRDKAMVRTNYLISGDSSTLSSGVLSTSGLGMIGVLALRGRGPTPYPTPSLNFTVGRSRLATTLVRSQAPAYLTLVLDDSITLDLGRVPVGTYRGPAAMAVVPMTVHLLPTWAIMVARARTAKLHIDGEVLSVRRQDLREFAALYRFATCDTVAAR